MATDDIGMESWRQTYLGDEPIYCAAPEKPEDILCLGSDHDIDENAKVARRLRYEEQGLRYLRGQPPRLLSASLRGPFDKASGWQNPWLPKHQTAQKRVATSPFPQSPAKKVRATKSILREELEKLARRDDGTLATRDSMHCHLPSPESHRGLQLTEHIQLDSDKRSRIQEWASTVPIDTLDKDDFWAPDQGAAEGSHAGSSKKRPAGKEWLKSKINKRTRVNQAASGIVSTPTPGTVPKPTSMATSVPSPTTQPRPVELTVSAVGRSLDMTTPCSSADKRVTRLGRQSSGGTQRVDTSTSEDAQSTSNAATKASPSQHIRSRMQPPVSTRSAMKPANETSSGLPARTNRQLALATVSESTRLESHRGAEHLVVTEPEVPGQQAMRNAEDTTGEQDGEEVDFSFVSHLDQSFHYKVRPTRLEIPVSSTPQDDPNCHRSQATQTGTPESEIHGDMVTVQANQALRNAVPAGRENDMHGDQAMNKIALPDNVVHELPLTEIMDGPSTSQLGVPGDLGRGSHSLRDGVDFLATGCEPKDTVLPPESESVVHEELMGTHMVILKDSGLENEMVEQTHAKASGDIQTRLMTTKQSFSEAVMDEGSTLIGDPMDIDESNSFQMAKPPGRIGDSEVPIQAAAHAARAKKACSAVRDGRRLSQSISASQTVTTPGIDKAQPLAEAAVADRALGTGSPSFMIQPLDMSWGAELVTSSPISRPEGIEDNVSEILIQIEPVDEGPAVAPTPDATLLQSPWVPGHFPYADPDVHYIRIDSPGQDQGVLRPRHISVLHTSSLNQQQPELLPPQQSPQPEVSELVQIDVAELPRTLHFVSTPELPKSASVGNDDGSHLPLPRRSESYVRGESPASLNHDNTMNSIEEPILEQPEQQPTTPSLLEGRQSTPDVELSIKSFAKFNTPSPKRKPMTFKYPRLSGERFPSTQILMDAANMNPWSSTHSQPRSIRRVSFAPLPGEEDGPDEPAPTSVTRAASPPPKSSTKAGDEDVDDNFQNHFNAMRRRSGEEPKFRLQARLLPSSSQQKPSSPAVGAMAEAFKAADAYRASPGIRINDDECNGPEVNAVQSPWRNDSQSQGVDDVAAVLQNLDDFLNPRWDIEAEMDKAGRTADGIENQGRKHTGDINFPDNSIWDVV